MPNALITGITGQDGSYLAEFLLEKGYKVFGLVRRSSAGPNLQNIKHIVDNIELLQGDMTDADSLRRAVHDSDPDEVYNLAAQSFVPMSWASPTYTINVNLGGFVYLLEAVMIYDALGLKKIKVYQASTSEMYGNSALREGQEIYDNNMAMSLDESSPMRPRSPYGASKLAAHRMAAIYRESFGIHVASGILFNHESPRRGPMFVTRKITKAVAAIFAGRQKNLTLGDLDARRDWGFAGDYVRAMWLMLQQDSPQDLVIGTGLAHSVEDCVAFAFRHAAVLTGFRLSKHWTKYIKKDDKFKRPAEIFILKANNARAKKVLGWKPEVSFDQLIREMVENDLKLEGLL